MGKFENREKLINWKNPFDRENTSEIFIQSMKEVLKHHSENNEFFNQLLKKENFSIDSLKTEEDLALIPMIPANFFKTYESLSMPREDIAVHLTSSGTTGQKSQMFFDQDSWDFGQSMVYANFEYNNFVSTESTNCIVFNYEPIPGLALGTAKTNQGMLKYAPVNEVFYALRYNGHAHDFDAFGTINKLREYEKEGKPVRIFGFPSFLYFTINQMMELKQEPLHLHPDSMAVFGGGWKGYAQKQIPKAEFFPLITKMLGIKGERIRDGYGSTEHSVPYMECSHHHFHVPIYSRLFVRDVKTLEVLPYGKPGFANFVTPHLLSVPALSVLMGDLVVAHPATECGCDRTTPYFEILGRAGTSSTKSCAIAASELLKR